MQFTNMFTGQTITSQPWQDELRPGDHYVIEKPGMGLMGMEGMEFLKAIDDLLIHGEILNAEECEEGFFNVRAYNSYCPDGEEGIVCIAEITRKISREEFETARIGGWSDESKEQCEQEGGVTQHIKKSTAS